MIEKIKILNKFADLQISEYKGYYCLERNNKDIGQTLLVNEDFKYVLEEFDKTVKEEYPNISKLNNFLNLTKNLNIDKIKDLEKRLGDSSSEKYQYIVKCNLVNSSDEYKNQYLLVKDLNNLESQMEIDLKGDLCFNCCFKVRFPKIIDLINSFQDLKEFCNKNNIVIPKERVSNNGIIFGADIESGLLINNNLEAIGWTDSLEEVNNSFSEDEEAL